MVLESVCENGVGSICADVVIVGILWEYECGNVANERIRIYGCTNHVNFRGRIWQ